MSWREALGVVTATPVGGGDINDAWRATLADGRVVFVKTARGTAPVGMFEVEAAGLAWLGSALRVPSVIACDAEYLALEWIELSGSVDPAAFGRGLAMLHRSGADRFGWSRDNYIATLPQANPAAVDWPTFYVEHRLRPLMPSADLDALLARRDVFGPPEPPARLHGDLWWGNVGATRDGAPVIFDPAVYGGHREIDLAMLALFGELPARMLDAYGEIEPLADGWRDRLALHQLYPLAVHARLFGGGYRARYERTLRQYVGTC